MIRSDSQELLYWVDENDQVLGSVARIEAHAQPGKTHRSVCILVTNAANQMLFQKRGDLKDLYPGQWSLSCRGHVLYGENYFQAADREVFEELNIHPHLFYVTHLYIKTPEETQHSHIYLCKITHTPEWFNRQELSEIAWVDINDIGRFTAERTLPHTDMEVLKALLYVT